MKKKQIEEALNLADAYLEAYEAMMDCGFFVEFEDWLIHHQEMVEQAIAIEMGLA